MMKIHPGPIYADSSPLLPSILIQESGVTPKTTKNSQKSPKKQKNCEFVQAPTFFKNTMYKHIYGGEREDRYFHDCYPQLFPNNLSKSLRQTLPEIYLTNPKPRIYENETEKNRQIKGILEEFNKLPSFTANRDQAKYTLLGLFNFNR